MHRKSQRAMARNESLTDPAFVQSGPVKCIVPLEAGWMKSLHVAAAST